MQMTQARWEVQPRHGYLHISAYAQGHHQCFRRSRGRCGAPPDNANWASATHSQEFSWYMEVALPAGDTQNVSLRCQMFSSFQCIIWFMLALIAEIPVVVCPCPSLDDIRLIVPQVCEVLNLNGMFLSPPFSCGQSLMVPLLEMLGTMCDLSLHYTF